MASKQVAVRHSKVTGKGWTKRPLAVSNEIADPCPWCGSCELHAEPHKRVFCRGCDALGPSPIDASGVNRHNAILLWNRRGRQPASTINRNG